MSGKSVIRLQVLAGPMMGKDFTFKEHDVFVLGRSPDCHCCLPDDPCISRHHFLLEANPPDCCIQDLGSLNGTYINGRKYGGRQENELPEKAVRRSRPVAIKHGDRIRIGDTVLEVGISVPPVSAAKPGNKQEELLARIVGDAVKKPAALPEIPGYRIERKLGEGGMGQVFLARQLKQDRIVALKTMLPKNSRVEEAHVLRFLREMATCARLKHPNIVAFLDQGHHNGVLYFAMEYCRDGSVHDLLKRQGCPLTAMEAILIIDQVLAGLVYAHGRDIVHRDLKPSNVLLSHSGSALTALIADFGLAKNFQQAGLSGMTMSGAYSGTMPFMPPEQVINFRDVKPVSDIFSVGATMYVMLTGCCVYDFREGEEPIRAILEKRVVPIRTRGVELPKKLAEAVDRATAPEPKDRFPTAQEFRTALRKV